MLRCGFIGFGRMGITHYSILNTHPSVKIVAVCDESKPMLGVLAKYLDVETFTDFRQMLGACELDFVVVSTPSGSHSEIVDAAVDKNLHVFVEKPFVLRVADGERILEKLNGRTLVTQVGYVNRFNEIFMEAKSLVESGVIGEIKHFTSEMYGATVIRNSKGGWRAKKAVGGGCLYEYGCHSIDLAVYLFGTPDRVAGSVLRSIYSSDVDDFVMSTFTYKNGCIGSIVANWSEESFRKPTNIIKIFGSEGNIIADRHSIKIFLKSDHEAFGLRRGWNTRYITDLVKSVRFYVRGNEFTKQLDYFVECIQNKKTDNVSSFSEAIKTDGLIEQIQDDSEEPGAHETKKRRFNTTPPDKTDASSLLERLKRVTGI